MALFALVTLVLVPLCQLAVAQQPVVGKCPHVEGQRNFQIDKVSEENLHCCSLSREFSEIAACDE